MKVDRKESALITGAASGIGRATALVLARRGADVALVDLDPARLQAVADEAAAFGGKVLALRASVAHSADLQAAVQRAAQAFGGLHTVVAAAGIARKGRVTEISEDEWDQVIEVNLRGVFLLARHALPHMIASGGGSFVAVSSDAGLRGSIGYAAYSASKHAVIGLVRCLALDHAREGIRSNAVCPGFVETPMADELFAENPRYDRAFYENRMPLGRLARADEVANVIAHLSSPEASYTNGMFYTVDGGTTAGTFG
ncbi:SDR family NAD(P)-dependent oxidoreductase [Paraburkholderia bonniea]|uniref:SDR family NAD(P)-dependent oxidoreductase n=1 Tax=Paraburkholderia bonniea TaxID=2152891 RepID=UPI00157FE033|nr:SDR family NAD(P)-dependent oxidoreductase [Paraburkholderia bonniea]WJF89629.1 SDR family NAD(P)-dependent oxidoreductase [Paraburkholderia bonniea]WJF92943.1 SDR family NAD(P)-dependent oxidoreductase [Paraburkholderia bonniea]